MAGQLTCQRSSSQGPRCDLPIVLAQHVAAPSSDVELAFSRDCSERPDPIYGVAVTNGSVTDHVANGLAWRELGDGDPLVFLHGLGGTRRAWGPQLRSLSDRYRCIAWDMPGYGNAAPIEPLTYPAIAQRVVDLLDTLNIDQATLIGLSFGGMHALHTALDHPDRVRRLVLADSSPAFGIDGTSREGWVKARLDPIDAGGSPADAAEAIVDAITHVQLEGIVRDETVGAFSDISSAGFRAAVMCLPDNDVRARLAEIKQPTLVVVGEHDEETPLPYSQLLTDGIPNATLRVLPGAGHLSPAEVPDLFNEALATFLETTDRNS